MSDIRGKTVSELQELNARGLLRRWDIPEYGVWMVMKGRCNNPNNARYKDWGGRGITVYEAWRRDFWTFLRHIGRRPHEGYVLDRIDNDGSYEPGNVRWVTPRVSSYNQRPDKLTKKLTAEAVEYIRSARDGPLTQTQLGEIFGVHQTQIGNVQRGKHHNSDGAFQRPPKSIARLIGEQHPRATLSNAQVADIKGLLLKGYEGPLIAERFVVQYQLVRRIARGEFWCGIEPNLDAILPPMPDNGGATITRRSLA